MGDLHRLFEEALDTICRLKTKDTEDEMGNELYKDRDLTEEQRNCLPGRLTKNEERIADVRAVREKENLYSWQPIATAPQNEWVLVKMSYHLSYVTSYVVITAINKGTWGNNWTDYNGHSIEEPNLWMHVPPKALKLEHDLEAQEQLKALLDKGYNNQQILAALEALN